MGNRRWTVILLLIGVGLTGLMYLLILGCRFGYDATVLLVIAEDWQRGFLPFHTYIESKPLGMIVLDRLLLWVCGKSPYGLHASALGCNLLLCLVPALGFRKYLRPNERIVTFVCLLAAGFLTEMQYLITEQPVAIFGVLGYILAFQGLSARHRLGSRAIIAGLLLGCSFMFKPVAAFYCVALAIMVAAETYHFRSSRLDWLRSWLVDMLLVTVSFLIPFGLACLWALQHQVLQEMLLQTLWDPFMCYKSHGIFLKQFLLKLSPLLVAWVICLFHFAYHWTRSSFDDELIRWQVGLLVFALVSSLALLKNQASHYFIPALPFLIPFIVSVSGAWIQQMNSRWLIALGGGLLASVTVLVGSQWQVLTERLRNPMPHDLKYARALVSETRPGEFALFINGLDRTPPNAYWFTGLRPPWPYLTIDQPSYCYLKRNKGLLLGAIANPKTAIVSWVPEDPTFYLSRALPFPQSEVDQAIQVLHQEYEPVPGVGGFYFRGLWKRKGRTAQERPFSAGPFSGGN